MREGGEENMRAGARAARCPFQKPTRQSYEPQPEGKHSEAKNRADDDEEVNLRPREGLAGEGWDERHAAGARASEPAVPVGPPNLNTHRIFYHHHWRNLHAHFHASAPPPFASR